MSEDSPTLVKTAFRKLKAQVYHDKTALPLRDRIVRFEADADFENKLKEMNDAYNSEELHNWSRLVKEILESINFLVFPKKMTGYCNSENSKNNRVIRLGSPLEIPEVEELQYFIDMDVRGHILGVMWIIEFALEIEQGSIISSRGNRLRNSLILDPKTNKPNLLSPALFEPYFAQYSLWRDEGLSCAKELLEKNHNALILTLDIKRFFYNAGLSKDEFNELFANKNARNKKLHSYIFSVLEKYSEILKNNNVDYSEVALPIGFLPSAVLSNLCLGKFDKAVLDCINPAYYGRYVDDILIVDKIEKGTKIYDLVSGDSPKKDELIELYLTRSKSDNLPLLVSTSKEKNNSAYKINPIYCPSNGKLEIHENKIKAITLFADNDSTAIIDSFKKELHENVSEFRLMPEIGDAFSQEDFSVFYKLENSTTVNKISGIREILIDKFELSKFLGKYRVVSSLVSDGKFKKNFTSKICKIFNKRELIENYILWERIFEIFIIDKDYEGYINFANYIQETLKSIKHKNNSITELTNSLNLHYSSAVNRTLSLICGEAQKKILNAVDNITIMPKMPESYFTTRMINKYVMPIPLEAMVNPHAKENISVNLTDFSDTFNYLCANCKEDRNNKDEDIKYEYLPYFRQGQDIAMAVFFRSLSCNKPDSIAGEYVNKIKNDIQNAPILAFPLFDDMKNTDKTQRIHVGNFKSDRLKIAIANVSVRDVWSLEDALKGKQPNRKYKRYLQLTELLNTTIKEKSDVLVLPENFLPPDWLAVLATKAAREGIAIIGGLEHIIANKKVYNYTTIILPFKIYDIIPSAAVFFQLKKFYAPDEKRIIEEYNYKAVQESQERPLYCWRDCYFPVYTCFELAAIQDRSKFMSWADMIVAVEYNRDTNYFGSILDSLTRDLHCYCVQVNCSEFGDSRITQPKKREEQNLISIKGGLNQSLLIGEINIKELREFQLKNYISKDNSSFKPVPPGFNSETVRKKLGIVDLK